MGICIIILMLLDSSKLVIIFWTIFFIDFRLFMDFVMTLVSFMFKTLRLVCGCECCICFINFMNIIAIYLGVMPQFPALKSKRCSSSGLGFLKHWLLDYLLFFLCPFISSIIVFSPFVIRKSL